VRLTDWNCNVIQAGGYRKDDATCAALRDVRSHVGDEHIILTIEMGNGKSDSCSGQLYRIFPHYFASVVEN